MVGSGLEEEDATRAASGGDGPRPSLPLPFPALSLALFTHPLGSRGGGGWGKRPIQYERIAQVLHNAQQDEHAHLKAARAREGKVRELVGEEGAGGARGRGRGGGGESRERAGRTESKKGSLTWAASDMYAKMTTAVKVSLSTAPVPPPELIWVRKDPRKTPMHIMMKDVCTAEACQGERPAKARRGSGGVVGGGGGRVSAGEARRRFCSRRGEGE